jgi:hypothetical protein
MSASDARWDREERGETPTERLDRNWTDLLQELRVLQTGVQLLTGFLLTVPFQQRFTTVSRFEKVIYLVTVSSSVLAAILILAPVSLHRVLFRQHQRRATVQVAHRLAITGQLTLGVALVGVVTLVFAVAINTVAAVVGAVATSMLLCGFWIVMPLRQRAAQPAKPRPALSDPRGG